MATLAKWLPWFFPTRTSQLATDTTVGTATRHDFSAITIDMPEGTRTIKSVRLTVTARDAFTSAVDFDGWRLGIKLGAAAFDDLDVTTALANTGDHETLVAYRDVTSYFVTNFGAGSTQTCQVGCAFATSAAANVVNITARLDITYTYDNGASTHVKTVEIVAQGHHTVISTSDVEIGTVSGTGNAPANQFPDLSTELPEAGKTYKQITAVITAMDSGNAITDFNATVTIDSGTADTRGTIEQALITSALYVDHVDLMAAPHSITTNAAHAFKMASSLASTFENVSVTFFVTYTFDASTTTLEYHSVRLPLENEDSTASNIGNTVGDEERYTARLDIQEPAPIRQRRVGAVIYDHMSSVNGLTLSVYNANQSVRTYAHANVGRSAAHIYNRRLDCDRAEQGLGRGENSISVDFTSNAGAGITYGVSGYVVVNYVAGVPALGIGAGNRTTCWSITSQPAESTLVTATQDRAPEFPESVWKVSGVFAHVGSRGVLSTIGSTFGAERAIDEGAGNGWYNATLIGGNTPELGRREWIVPVTRWCRLTNYATRGMSLTRTGRRWRFFQQTSMGFGAALWVTHHSCTFTVAGNYSIDGVAYQGQQIVDVFANDETTGASEKIATTNTDGVGDYSVTVPDNTRFYSVTGRGTTGAGAAGYPSPAPAGPPSVRSVGVAVSGIGAVTPAWPRHEIYDIALLICESNSGEAVSLSAPEGFVEIADSPQDSTGSRLTMFWCRASSSTMTSPTVADPGDHVVAQIIVIKGCVRTGNPWDVTAGDTAATSTAVSVPGDTTTVGNCLVLAVTTSGQDSTTPQITDTTWANSSLDAFRAYVATNVADGGGGGFYVAAGVKESAGAYSASTATLSNTSTQGRISIALKPYAPSAGNFDLVAYTSGPAGGGGYAYGRVVNGC